MSLKGTEIVYPWVVDLATGSKEKASLILTLTPCRWSSECVWRSCLLLERAAGKQESQERPTVKARAGRASSVKKTRVWVVCFSWSIVERSLRKAKSWKNQWRRQHLFYSRPSLSAALLCAVSVPCSLKILNGKFQKETIHKFEIACHSEECDEILSPSHSVPPGIWIPPLSSISLPVSHLVAISIIRLIIKGHIHTTFITVHCYNCSILLLVNCC